METVLKSRVCGGSLRCRTEFASFRLSRSSWRLCWFARSRRGVPAYVEVPITLGDHQAIHQHRQMQGREGGSRKNLIIYQKFQDIKGKHAGDQIKHNIGRGGLRAGEWEEIMKWAEVGKQATFSTTVAERNVFRHVVVSGLSPGRMVGHVAWRAIFAPFVRRQGREVRLHSRHSRQQGSCRAWSTATRRRFTRRPRGFSG